MLEVLLYIVALHFLCGAIASGYYVYLCRKDKEKISGRLIRILITQGYFALAVFIVIDIMVRQEERRNNKNEKDYENYYE